MLVFGGRNRRGRRKQFDGPPVSVRLPKDLHDDLSIEAIQRHVDLSDVIRERLAKQLRIPKIGKQ